MASMEREYKGAFPGDKSSKHDADGRARKDLNLDHVDNGMRFGNMKRVHTLSHSPDGS